jgi:hypothetical protein
MNFTTFAMVLTFSGNKIDEQDFLHRGWFDPKPLTAGARGHAGRPRWPVARACHGHGGREPVGSPAVILAGRRAGKGPPGPGTHPEAAGEVDWAGGAPTATNWRRRTSVPAGKNGDGFSGHPASIPRVGRRRAAQRS